MEKLTQDDIGRWVMYIPATGERECGKIKRYNNKQQVAWVVYKCGDNWDQFENYTAAATKYQDLEFAREYKWWGYKHAEGGYQAKPVMHTIKSDLKDAYESPFVEMVVEPFEFVTTQEPRSYALSYVKMMCDSQHTFADFRHLGFDDLPNSDDVHVHGIQGGSGYINDKPVVRSYTDPYLQAIYVNEDGEEAYIWFHKEPFLLGVKSVPLYQAQEALQKANERLAKEKTNVSSEFIPF